MKSHTDIVLIDDGKMGIVNLNGMIPVPKDKSSVLLKEVEYKVSDDDDEERIRYKNLIQKQMSWLNKLDHKAIILKKAIRTYNLYDKLLSSNKLRQRCCNFKYLEKISESYK